MDHPFSSLEGQDLYIQCWLYIMLETEETKDLLVSSVLIAVPCEIQKLFSVLIEVETKFQLLFFERLLGRVKLARR